MDLDDLKQWLVVLIFLPFLFHMTRYVVSGGDEGLDAAITALFAPWWLALAGVTVVFVGLVLALGVLGWDDLF